MCIIQIFFSLRCFSKINVLVFSRIETIINILRIYHEFQSINSLYPSSLIIGIYVSALYGIRLSIVADMVRHYKLQRSVHRVNLSVFQLVAERVRRQRINWVSATVAVCSWLSKSATCVDSCWLNCRRCATDHVLNYRRNITKLLSFKHRTLCGFS